MKKITSTLIAPTFLLLSLNTQANPIPATEDGLLGLYSADNFTITDGQCQDCATIPQALWYFKKELIAVPKKVMPIAVVSKADFTLQEVVKNQDEKALPPLVWLSSQYVIPQARLNDNGTMVIETSSLTSPFFITNKIPSNLSYWNDSTLQFFKQRDVRLRGELTDKGFTARTVWPLDFKIDANANLNALNTNESLKSLVQYENGGAKSVYESRLLWEKAPGVAKEVAGKAVLAFMLNGAQGDDDEAHGGHFAVVTGRMEADGNYSRWLVNNYYNLAANSEKGIIAGITPMDKYLADLNSGQSFYRPSYMLVAVLKSDTVPSQFQATTNRIYNHFYRNDFVYDHSRNNCAGTSIDTLRALGWNIPTRGVESQLKATAAYIYVAATEMSLSKGRAIYDYLNTETTRLFPAVTFDAIGENLLLGANQWSSKLYTDHNPTTPFMRQISEDIEAIYFVRIPQIPSSRAFGLAPVYSFDQYMHQAPADRSQWKIIPTTPNPLPEALKDGAALKLASPSLLPLPVAAVLMFIVGGLTWLIRKLLKRNARN
ncbi:hypothetical protein [Methylotenera versatilis]|uniref:Uncharacterized protein n=1 Tax=Methylotenera versatilis (strain 301) TaxID=666681 RepID=D7DNK4_METV0|nr:hypothetical protein [Methylotenera versatilis]ADI31005.1 hypothetical protein M301_2650 [Methylotenera versatilis 301]